MTCATASRCTLSSTGTATAADISALLPVLSTYLGHVEPANTYWYLSAVPELMQLAAARLEQHQAGQS